MLIATLTRSLSVPSESASGFVSVIVAPAFPGSGPEVCLFCVVSSTTIHTFAVLYTQSWHISSLYKCPGQEARASPDRQCARRDRPGFSPLDVAEALFPAPSSRSGYVEGRPWRAKDGPQRGPAVCPWPARAIATQQWKWPDTWGWPV